MVKLWGIKIELHIPFNVRLSERLNDLSIHIVLNEVSVMIISDIYVGMLFLTDF